MAVKRKHIDQLNSSQSWQSPLACIAHIDLDAFYAQCLAVRINLDPEEPAGCRQWQSLIAVNYPARKFGIKRGMTVDEARQLCPGIHLPHVATFKKGEIEWKFHENPTASQYKVSLDYFRCESRKIFGVFKQSFKVVQKAGIDEGFIDLGPEVYKQIVKRFPEIFEEGVDPDTEISTLTYRMVLDIAAELVHDVGTEIHSTLKYTCSAGIGPTKQLAKLGSGFKKPFARTVVYGDDIYEFLSNFPVTKIGGWRGKLGKSATEAVGIPEDVKDQCKFVRDHFSLADLERKLHGDTATAKQFYDMVRGGSPVEVVSRTIVKSMIAVKNFRDKHLKTQEDIDSWLVVYSADIAGRLDDLEVKLIPKTISVKQFNTSKQQLFVLKGSTTAEIREQIYQQSAKIAKEFIPLPCSYMAVEVSNFYELPRERVMFKTIKSADEEKLFVDDDESENVEHCEECKKNVPVDRIQEHRDWHFAKQLMMEERSQAIPPAKIQKTSPKKRSSPKKPQTSKQSQQDTRLVCIMAKDPVVSEFKERQVLINFTLQALAEDTEAGVRERQPQIEQKQQEVDVLHQQVLEVEQKLKEMRISNSKWASSILTREEQEVENEIVELEPLVANETKAVENSIKLQGDLNRQILECKEAAKDESRANLAEFDALCAETKDFCDLLNLTPGLDSDRDERGFTRPYIDFRDFNARVFIEIVDQQIFIQGTQHNIVARLTDIASIRTLLSRTRASLRVSSQN